MYETGQNMKKQEAMYVAEKVNMKAKKGCIGKNWEKCRKKTWKVH